MFWKDFSKKVFPNEIALEYDLSSTIRKNDISFSRKYDIVSCQKVKDDLSQKIHGNMIFFVYTCECYKHGVTPPVIPQPQPKKIKDDLLLQKYT